MPISPPSYSNPGGVGDRKATVAVTTSTGLVKENPLNLVDGLFGNNGNESVSFFGGSAAGVYFRFDFGIGASRLITEATWKQSGAQSHGTFQWRGSNDLVDYTDIGSTFTLGGSTSQVQTTLSGNVDGFRYYELVGVSGALNIGPYIQEIEFKIGPTLLDGRVFVPRGGEAGEALVKLSDAYGDVAFGQPRRIHPMQTTDLLAEWYFDEGAGDRAANVRSGDGTRDIVFDATFRSTYASTPEWTRRGLSLDDDLVQSPTIPGVRTVATLYRIKRGDVGIVMSGGSGGGQGTFGESVSTIYSHWVACGQGVAPLAYNASVGNGAFRLNRGGWLLVFTEFDAAYDTPLGWGGRFSSLNGPRAQDMELAWAACWSSQLDADGREAVFAGVRRVAAEREIYLHWRDCPDFVDCVLLWGQSNVTGYSRIADMTADDQARVFIPNVLVSHLNNTGNAAAMPEELRFQYNHRINMVTTRTGPLPGAAWAHEDARTTRQRKLLVNQSAIDATYLAPSSITGTGGATSWNVAEILPGGILWAALTHWWETEQRMLLKGVGPRLRTMWYFQGEEDSVNTAYSANWQTYIGDLWTEAKSRLATPADFDMKLVKTPVLNVVNGFDPTANAQVRAAQVAFAAAEADVELIDCDDLAQQADDHFTGPAMKVCGERLYAATDLT